MVAYLLTKAAEWNIPQADVDEMETLTAGFDTALETAENPLTRTKVAIIVINKLINKK
jgi:hypothetical protein